MTAITLRFRDFNTLPLPVDDPAPAEGSFSGFSYGAVVGSTPLDTADGSASYVEAGTFVSGGSYHKTAITCRGVTEPQTSSVDVGVYLNSTKLQARWTQPGVTAGPGLLLYSRTVKDAWTGPYYLGGIGDAGYPHTDDWYYAEHPSFGGATGDAKMLLETVTSGGYFALVPGNTWTLLNVNVQVSQIVIYIEAESTSKMKVFM